MDLRITIKRAIPSLMLNKILLTLPFLYHTKIVNYETNLSRESIDDLLSQLDVTLELEGDIIECGSSRCGGSIIMANHLKSRRVSKRIHACDSFEGFDRNELIRERESGLTAVAQKSFTSTSYEYVKSKIRKLGVDDLVVPVKGFFQNTLPHINSKFCLAFIDCDLKDSMLYCAETIWPNLVNHGRILFDDYTDVNFKGARPAIDHFVSQYRSEIREHGLLNRLYRVVKRP